MPEVKGVVKNFKDRQSYLRLLMGERIFACQFCTLCVQGTSAANCNSDNPEITIDHIMSIAKGKITRCVGYKGGYSRKYGPIKVED